MHARAHTDKCSSQQHFDDDGLSHRGASTCLLPVQRTVPGVLAAVAGQSGAAVCWTSHKFTSMVMIDFQIFIIINMVNIKINFLYNYNKIMILVNIRIENISTFHFLNSYTTMSLLFNSCASSGLFPPALCSTASTSRCRVTLWCEINR